MRQLPIQQEFFRKHGLRWFVGAKLGPNERVFLSIDRSEKHERFSDPEIAICDLIAQHLDRALGIVWATDVAAGAGAMWSFETLGKAAFMLTRDMRMIALNPKAEAHLGAGLSVSGGRLRANDVRSNDALIRLVAEAANPDFALSRTVPTPVAVKRSVGRPLIASATPYRSATQTMFRGPRAILLLTDPDAIPPIASEAILRHAFRLTPAEARLAAALAKGASIESCAQTFHVSVATLRNQLSAIFGKTGVHRQVDLVALVRGSSA